MVSDFREILQEKYQKYNFIGEDYKTKRECPRPGP